MIPLAVDELEALELGALELVAGSEAVTGVQIDSRRVRPGDLFVAVGGGISFLRDARERGAAATLVPREPFAALASLAAAVRARSRARVAAITGSVGKTSTKDMLAGLCRPHRSTVAAERSFNNELGVPLTICRLEANSEVCVLELAMRGFGQIASLAAVARPHVGVITNVGPAHLELVGSVEGVARAKAELLAALPAGGTAVIPAGERPLEPFLVRSDLEILRFGDGGDVRLETLEPEREGARATVQTPRGAAVLELPTSAPHAARNLLAAVAAYLALGLPLEGIGRGSGEIELSPWRGEEIALPGGGVLINDCYNANPLSMSAGLEHLAARSEGRRRVAVLGDMAELGPEQEGLHRQVGAVAQRLGVDLLLAVGPLARSYLEGAPEVRARWATSVDDALPLLHELLRPGDCVLVKASRTAGLEMLVEALAGAAVA